MPIRPPRSRAAPAEAGPLRAGAVRRVLAMLFAGLAGAAGAVTITAVTPQGEVAQVQQVVVAFSAAVVPLGDARQPDPVELACEGATPRGQGRWLDARRWVLDLQDPLPPGAACRVTVRETWKPETGAALEGRRSYAFSTGGPFVVSSRPWPGSTIEEGQHVLLTLNGAPAPATLAGRVWCEVDGIGERIPAQVVTGPDRDTVLRSQRVGAEAAERSVLLACQRPLPADTAVRLVWGAGIGAARNPAVVTRTAQTIDFRVRARFTAEFGCERERAQAPCLPIRPMTLHFSAPVPRDQALQARLVPLDGGAPVAPVRDPREAESPEVSDLRFPIPQPENRRWRVELPAGLHDVSNRPLSNATAFPLEVGTGAAPPIAKFAAAPFGILEWTDDTALPVTLRHVQGDLRVAATGGQVRVLSLRDDAEILAAYARVQKLHETTLTAREAGLPESQWTESVREVDDRGRVRTVRRDRDVQTRTLSMLGSEPRARRLDLPALDGGDPRPFEVVGIPIAEPGFHVVEIESRALGAALLDRQDPMYVRTGVLVTNLGLHFKQGRESSLAWVTSLDRGRPQADADVAVHDCRGRRLWAGRTDASGVARIAEPLAQTEGECPADAGYYVTARFGRDQAFLFSTWQRGIEGWRFNVPISTDPEPDLRAHTLFDRTLLRAGETVSMKHFIRRESAAGLAPLAPAELPTRAVLVHTGSGQRFTVPLAWSGVRSAVSSWNIPPAAKLGAYEVTLERDAQAGGDPHAWEAGRFRVEEFRVPLVDAVIEAPRAPVIAPSELPLAVHLQHLSGGPVGRAPVSVSAVLRPVTPGFPGLEDYSFAAPRNAASGDEDEPDAAPERLVADRLPATTDAQGAATVTVKNLSSVEGAAQLRAELTFDDPNGEVQTVTTQIPVWPSAVVLGVRTASWASEAGRVKVQVAALDTAGRPLRDQAVEVTGRLHTTQSTRKRIVGGFYAYENRHRVEQLGRLCSGRSDASGHLECEVSLERAGQVELVASARDADGRAAQAARAVWITGHGELWFDQDNDDRIELLPEKSGYAGGDTARLQLRMPYREATVLVTVEREGVMDARVLTLRGDDPTIRLKVDPAWGPNIYVGALALRGRLRDVPWYSFFTWGWKGPIAWWRAYRDEGRDYVPPTAMVDLAKPSFKFGLARLRVGLEAQRLQVEVRAGADPYPVRGKADVVVRVSLGGKPMAGAELAFAAVDEGLLALAPNASWAVLESMWRERALGVETATGAGEIIGRRHYGRKAAPPGGGGGRNPTRELFDTLLLWQPRVSLDERGEARLQVPLNDSLTSFRLVAVADAEPARFGTGSTTIRVSQDLQMLSGLPPLVREGDRYSAGFTLRNTTARAMTVTATLTGTVHRGAEAVAELQHTPLALAPQTVPLAAGASVPVQWAVTVPAEALSITWEGAVDEGGGKGAHDALRVMQAVAPAVPVRVVQSTLQQIDDRLGVTVRAPANALADTATQIPRGGVAVGVQPKLAGTLPGVRRFFERYPYACLEQKTSKAIGLRDAALWAATTDSLPTYLDTDGLAGYFPPRSGDAPRGSDRLTAYLLAAAHEAGYELPAPSRDAMLAGLTAFVEGRIRRSFWSPRPDLDARRLAAIEALSRYGRARAEMVEPLAIDPRRWPTSAVIDWLRILQRVEGIAQRDVRRDEAQQVLRSRLDLGGTALRFATEPGDDWWWLMEGGDTNAARLILAVLDEPAWKDDVPRLVTGALARQHAGAWSTTTANLWGSLALDRFSAAFESTPVQGRTTATLGDRSAEVEWGATPTGDRHTLPWPAAGSDPAELVVDHDGTGRPWVTLQSLAALPPGIPVTAGYALTRRLTAVEQKVPGRFSRGDTVRVTLEIQAASDMTWVALNDPVPAGATILGSGLGRDSQIAQQARAASADAGAARPTGALVAYDERGFDGFRRYFEFLPRGRHVVEYVVRLNTAGRFHLPPSRVEALYAPDRHAELPIDDLEVAP